MGTVQVAVEDCVELVQLVEVDELELEEPHAAAQPSERSKRPLISVRRT